VAKTAVKEDRSFRGSVESSPPSRRLLHRRERGVLSYRGFDIHELAPTTTFEETCFLRGGALLTVPELA
jgi:citrate synthase